MALEDQVDEQWGDGGDGQAGHLQSPVHGIPPVQVQVLKEDKLQIEKAYMGLVFLYGDKQERLPVVQRTDNLENEISSVVKKMT